jgi:peptide/nickel transport system substrate-binding protein
MNSDLAGVRPRPWHTLTRRGFLVVALASALTTRDSAAAGVPRIGLTDLPTGAPADTWMPGANWASQLWGEPLLAISTDGTLVNAISNGIIVSIERTTITLGIRPDALFSDGQPIGAGDGVASISAAIEQAAETGNEWRFEFIESVEAIDGRTVAISLSEPDASIPATLASQLVPVLPASWLDGSTPRTGYPSASGAFVRLTMDAERVECRRSTTFYQVGRPRLDGLTCLPADSAMPRAMQLVSGQCDILVDVSPLDIPTLRENPGFSLVGGPANSLCHLRFNVERPALDDRRVRRLLQQAVDREAVVEAAASGEGVAATSLIAPDHWAGLAEPLETIPTQEAREDIAALGYRSGLALRLAVDAGDPVLVNAAVTLQDQFAYLGFAVDVAMLDTESLAEVIPGGEWDLLVTTTPFWYDPHELIRPLLVTGAPSNPGGFSSSRIDYLTDLARRARQQEYRGDTYRTIQRIVRDEVPLITLFHPNYHDAISGAILNYPAFPPRSARAMHQATMKPIEPAASPSE